MSKLWDAAKQARVVDYLAQLAASCEHCPGCNGYAYKWEDIDHSAGCEVAAIIAESDRRSR